MIKIIKIDYNKIFNAWKHYSKRKSVISLNALFMVRQVLFIPISFLLISYSSLINFDQENKKDRKKDNSWRN